MRELGRMLKLQVRSGDIACRYGGEEFVVILQESPPEASMQRAEQLRASVMSMRLPSVMRPGDNVTISIGVASFPDDGNSREIVLGAADRALYVAKQQRRNRVVRAA
jgi:diguanylate cyclase (GGDEF)-like protein